MRQQLTLNWLNPGWDLMRWLLLVCFGIFFMSLAFILALVRTYGAIAELPYWLVSKWMIIAFVVGGALMILVALRSLVFIITRSATEDSLHPIEHILHTRHRQRGPRVVAVGGGTGLPSALRALKPYTNNITAVVTVADDGGSSGRLRREMGVLPPGDLRNNIVALSDDESLMAKLFQYRFQEGDLKGHSFGNLFISALSNITDGNLETALVETGRILNIQGRVLPSTLENVNLRAQVQMPDTGWVATIFGEEAISEAGGLVTHMELVPKSPEGYSESVEAILRAELIVLGPGSLYTSIIPNLLVPDIASALRATPAYIVYICNVATQPGETADYTVAEHIMAIENLIGRGVFQAVLANNAYPPPPPDSQTVYVQMAPEQHQVRQRYEIFYTDLTDDARPWRHDPAKLATALMALYNAERYGTSKQDIFAGHLKAG
jgi:uncharacterized cofD-like protein